MKSEIIERLGETDILLPSLIAEGLSANDRVKVRLSVLQTAARHARNPNGAHFDLTEECRAVGIDPVATQMLINHASPSAEGAIAAPDLGKLRIAIWDDVETMARAVKAGNAGEGDLAFERLAAIKGTTSVEGTDTIALAQINKLAGIADNGGDSLHRLVMDLHKALNRLAATHAEETISGAHVYGLLPQDRSIVEAFVRGVESTQRLKFGHPGLATTATRSGERVTIQNDIGETDAHVVVIAVERNAITITYTDVHRPRVEFFTNLFRKLAVQWSGLDRKSSPGLGEDGAFYLVTGRCPVEDDASRNTCLEAIGASLVFLIDWNKARKVLRTWVSKSAAVNILDWAARNRLGHRAFLELGGSELVASAVHNAAPTRIGFGERLDRALGHDAAVDFLKTVLRVSTETLLEGGSVRLARDRIEADLVRHLQRVNAALLEIVIRQAGLAREIAVAIADFVAKTQTHRPFDQAALAARARRIEEKADKIAIEARSEIVRFDAAPAIEPLVNSIEEAIDELEQASFIASLVPSQVAPELLTPLAELCLAAISGAEAAAAGVVAAIDVPDGHRIDSEDALAAISRLAKAEHDADAAERAVTTIVLRGEFDLKTSLSILELARAIERATDCLARFGHLLRERVLADLSV